MQSIGIIGVGSYLPEAIISNAEIGHGAGVTDEWIVRKTGIRERRRAAPHEATSDLAVAAAQRALDSAGLTAEQLAYVVVATSTPDHPQPATAALVQHRIGAHRAAAFDVNAVCSGFVYALKTVEKLLAGAADGEPRHGLVIGADIYSRILDYTDRRTAALFGDGAGATVLGPVAPGLGLRQISLVSRGDAHRLIEVTAGGSRRPPSTQTLTDGDHYFRMDGRGYAASSPAPSRTRSAGSCVTPRSGRTPYSTSSRTRPTASCSPNSGPTSACTAPPSTSPWSATPTPAPPPSRSPLPR